MVQLLAGIEFSNNTIADIILATGKSELCLEMLTGVYEAPQCAKVTWSEDGFQCQYKEYDPFSESVIAKVEKPVSKETFHLEFKEEFFAELISEGFEVKNGRPFYDGQAQKEQMHLIAEKYKGTGSYWVSIWSLKTKWVEKTINEKDWERGSFQIL